MADESSIGQRIARARHRLGLTQLALSQRIGVDPMQVSRWERGRTPRTGTLLAIARALELTLEEIVGCAVAVGHATSMDPADQAGSHIARGDRG
jgi:transcriptional regulator with XRE-family HTH domain